MKKTRPGESHPACPKGRLIRADRVTPPSAQRAWTVTVHDRADRRSSSGLSPFAAAMRRMPPALCSAYRIRTCVNGLRGRCPRPLDECAVTPLPGPDGASGRGSARYASGTRVLTLPPAPSLPWIFPPVPADTGGLGCRQPGHAWVGHYEGQNHHRPCAPDEIRTRGPPLDRRTL